MKQRELAGFARNGDFGALREYGQRYGESYYNTGIWFDFPYYPNPYTVGVISRASILLFEKKGGVRGEQGGGSGNNQWNYNSGVDKGLTGFGFGNDALNLSGEITSLPLLARGYRCAGASMLLVPSRKKRARNQ